MSEINNYFNPDVLNCIANLSSDEVFTPPSIANAMLDLLPKEIWKDRNAKFLDPFTKSGVFLREITKRLLEAQMPNYQFILQQIEDKKKNSKALSQKDNEFLNSLQVNIDYILHNQVYGIAITELTSLLSRRSLYCSKYPNCKYSISKFDNAEGNIRFKRVEHTWKNGKCIFCGASQSEYDRDKNLETHAYEFIHVNEPKEIFNMKFDVIIGNPPYQMSDGGNGASAMPIYQKFIEQAKKLNPKYLSMIVPARWYAGGRGLDEFRKQMLTDSCLRIIHDFPNASECFPGVEIKGGVCYFLWKRDEKGLCKVINHSNGKLLETERELLERGCDTFIRYNQAISILHKVISYQESTFNLMVSPNDPFGYDVRVENSYLRIKPDIKLESFSNSVKIYYYGWRKKGIGYISKDTVRKNQNMISGYKIFISRAYGAGENFPHQILGVPFISEENSVCTETYLMIGPVSDLSIANNILSYISTKFFRFLVMLKKNTQSATPAVYELVPTQDFSKPWTDEELYQKYALSQEEIDFIESMIKPMDLSTGDDGDE
ncbi:MAG: Eco57I restriction-modification methylase domain-containing protein [Anaeroplasmataceae bacterium]|nr:Eco57I restriction-modification methylase domain-containing protein [Anaeroplasmataceae bacterium]MDE6415363.1 Eco57I restriction-modification methylase domain-containing protein [Anaeroplasmataceae bacterium]